MAREFDGSNDEIVFGLDTAARNSLENGGSIFLWHYPDSDGENNAGRPLDCRDSANTGWQLAVVDELTGGVKFEFIARGTSSNGQWTMDNRNVTIGSWGNGTIVYDGSSASNDPSIYVDGGSAESITEGTTPTAAHNGAGGDIHIGDNYLSNVRHYDGRIAHAGLWDIELSSIERGILNKGVNPFIVRNENLTFYIPLHGNNNPENEYVIPETGTLTNTSKAANNPPVELLENYL